MKETTQETFESRSSKLRKAVLSHINGESADPRLLSKFPTHARFALLKALDVAGMDHRLKTVRPNSAAFSYILLYIYRIFI